MIPDLLYTNFLIFSYSLTRKYQDYLVTFLKSVKAKSTKQLLPYFLKFIQINIANMKVNEF